MIALALLAYPAYQGVRWAVRVHVDNQIERMEGMALPSFSLTGDDGAVYSPETLRGRIAVLNFFRSRCVNCLAEKETIKSLVREVDEDKVLVLGVMTDAALGFPAELSAETLEYMGYEHPVVMADREFMDAFHGVRWSNVTPVTYIVNAAGNIIRSMRGDHSLAQFRAALADLE